MGTAAANVLRLLHGVLADGPVEHEQRLVRRIRSPLLDDADDLLELVHEVVARVETARGIDDHDVRVARVCGIDRVERHRRRVAARLSTNELRASALRPQPELIDGARSERVAGRHHDALALGPKLRRELPDERRLARAVHADDENDHRLVGRHEHRRVAVPAPERTLDAVSQRLEELLLRANLPTLCELLDLGNETHGGRHSEVGLEQQFLELLERPVLDATTGDDADVGERDILDALPERLFLAGALNNSGHVVT